MINKLIAYIKFKQMLKQLNKDFDKVQNHYTIQQAKKEVKK